MPSHSEKQAHFMTANCKSAKFRKKTGVPKSVACDFHDADKGTYHEEVDFDYQDKEPTLLDFQIYTEIRELTKGSISVSNLDNACGVVAVKRGLSADDVYKSWERYTDYKNNKLSALGGNENNEMDKNMIHETAKTNEVLISVYNIACLLFESSPMWRSGGASFNEDEPYDIHNDVLTFDIRYFGDWVVPDDYRNDDDYSDDDFSDFDWQVPTEQTAIEIYNVLTKINDQLKIKKIRGIELSFSVEEKNYISINIAKKKRQVKPKAIKEDRYNELQSCIDDLDDIITNNYGNYNTPLGLLMNLKNVLGREATYNSQYNNIIDICSNFISRAVNDIVTVPVSFLKRCYFILKYEDFTVTENKKSNKKMLKESILSPLEKIAIRIHSGEFSTTAPKVSEKEIQRKFRDAIRETYGHSFDDEKTRNIFNQAWYNGKDAWTSLAEEYDRITRNIAPESIIDNNAIIEQVISLADTLMKSESFLSNPKEVRRKMLVKYIGEQISALLNGRGSKMELVENILSHYETKYNVKLKQIIQEDDTTDDFDDMLDSSESKEQADDDLDSIDSENLDTGEERDTNKTNSTEAGNDTVTFDVPLLIRILECVREEIRTDVILHRLATNLIRLSKEKEVLTMVDYEEILNGINGSEIAYLKSLSGIKDKK